MTSPTTDAAQPSPLTPPASSIRGRFLWYDLMTPDVDAAVAFYTAVTGLGTAKWSMGENLPAYTMWTNGETPIGGTMTLPAEEVARGTKPHWLAYVGTADCDATFQQALALGATACVQPTDIPTVGRYAALLDPQGALFALYTPENAPPPAPFLPTPGTISWHELKTTELAPAESFYEALFGWERTMAMDMGPAGTYQMFGHGQITYGGMYGTGPETSPAWLLYIMVPDLDAALDRVRAHGGAVTRGPDPIPGGRIAHATDPQGGAFALHAAEGEMPPPQG